MLFVNTSILRKSLSDTSTVEQKLSVLVLERSLRDALNRSVN